MQGLSSADILRIWEVGLRRNNAERALLILAAACPELAGDAVAGLAVGQRDALLLEVRAQTFGPDLAATARCPACAEPLEFTLRIADLRVTDGSAVRAGSRLTWAGAGWEVVFRLPTAADLAAIGDLADPQAAAQALLARCVLQACRDGAEVPASALPDDVAAALAAEMAAHDPQAELLLDLSCPACGHDWQAPLDIAAFFWAELAAQARRLLREVDVLARAYGWPEADILALSAPRRQAYLELAQG